MKNDNYKIAAVVVTYNRLELLKECVQSIREQTRKLDEIIVINNSSTDGTYKWLSEQNDLTVITQENSGSAGGQYTGIKTAYEKGYDWVWCMDDDVITYTCTLERLFEKSRFLPNIGYLCSNVISKDENYINVPVVDFRKIENGYQCWNQFLNHNCVLVREATFVSILISKIAISVHGFPDKRLFIWGDDYEYTLRISRSFNGYLVGDSLVRHLRESTSELNISKENSIDRINNYFYFFRNGIHITKRYYSFKFLINYILEVVLKRGLINSIKSRSNVFRKIKIVIKGSICGIIYKKNEY